MEKPDENRISNKGSLMVKTIVDEEIEAERDVVSETVNEVLC
jgi:hypothetical protein